MLLTLTLQAVTLKRLRRSPVAVGNEWPEGKHGSQFAPEVATSETVEPEADRVVDAH